MWAELGLVLVLVLGLGLGSERSGGSYEAVARGEIGARPLRDGALGGMARKEAR